MSKNSQHFEDLVVWQEGMDLCCSVYQSIRHLKEYNLKDQIFRSAISISSNIAEGFERQSEKEFLQFLNYAKGSSGELRTQLQIANRLGLVDEDFCKQAIVRSRRLSAMLQNLISSIKTKIALPPKN